MFIITLFSLLALPEQNKVDPKREKKASSILHVYRKCGTHARVFVRTLAHGNNKIKIGRRNGTKKQAENNENEKKNGHERTKSSDGLTVPRAYRPPGVATPRGSG